MRRKLSDSERMNLMATHFKIKGMVEDLQLRLKRIKNTVTYANMRESIVEHQRQLDEQYQELFQEFDKLKPDEDVGYLDMDDQVAYLASKDSQGLLTFKMFNLTETT